MRTPSARVGWTAAVALLAACGEPPPDGPVPVGSSVPAESSGAPHATPDGVPPALLGTFDTDSQACAQQTTMSRLTIRPDSLRFYYGYATVDSVARRAEGVEVDATLYHLEGAVEVVPEPVTYRLAPRPGGAVRFEAASLGAEPVELVRCPTAPG